ncbi:MAG: hypothetical protein K6A23_00275 [Butyrivibrio sp.]|nr:hypothetical protein [Butyrivibrio sp.]
MDDMDNKDRETASETFIVNIQRTQNSSWQGDITWSGGNGEKLHFRSGLELLKIMDSAMDKTAD